MESNTLGKYQLLKKIAAGGMAEIFIAKVQGLPGFEKIVVIKRILPQLATNQEFISMFLDEARIAATLQHANIVQMYDIGAVDGNYFISMEYLFGEDVRTVLKGVKGREGWLPLPHALNIIIGMSAGLHYAHDKVGFDGKPLGIVHRDATPQNVFVTYDGGVKIVDFGIAKATNRLNETRYGTLKGKIPYMSPEQCKSEPLDRRSDIYAIGIMLYEMTTGVRLYKAQSEFELLKKIVEDPVPPPSLVRPGYPKDLEPIVLKALAKKRDSRYQTARELQADLEGFAREHRLNLSAIALSSFMQEIFPNKVEAWRDAQAHGKDLAAHIAERADESKSGAASSPSGVSGVGEIPMFSTEDLEEDSDDEDDLDEPAAVAAGKATRAVRTVEASKTPTAAGQLASRPVRTTEQVTALPAPSPPPKKKLVWIAAGGVGVAAAIVLAVVMSGGQPSAPSAAGTPMLPLAADAGGARVELPVGSTDAAVAEVGAANIDAGGEVAIVAAEDGTVAVVTRPPGATVSVDGRAWKERTPTVLTGLDAGSHAIKVELRDHAVHRDTVTVVAGQEVALDLELKPKGGKHVADKPPKDPKEPPKDPPKDPVATGAPGELRVASTPSCEVIVDGTARGSTPIAALKLSPGKHTVQLVNSRFQIDRTFTVEIKSGEVTKKKYDFPVDPK